MNKYWMIVCAAAVFAGAAPVFAETVTGEVVDLGCYLDHGAKGEKHQKCAMNCIKGGMPVGVLTDDGKVYLVIGQHHKPANDQLADLAAKKVTIEGKVGTQNGVSIIVAEKIEPTK